MKIPSGYVKATGIQPRIPKDNEPYLNSFGFVQSYKGKSLTGKYIILKKKEI